ncbi:hypothetical protein AAFN60_02090 [Roseibacillus persicicus]|uniref:hypothetical protein n=1 Tax=Roseibacillus persicicus TaxID=454148 RepID=UPI00398B814F
MAIWTIKGEASKTLDDTARTIEQLALTGPTLEFESLEPDTFTATQQTDVFATVPEAGQTIEIFHNSTRVFKGHIRPSALTYQRGSSRPWKAVGPLWHLDQIQLTTDITDATGEENERAQIVFPTDDLKDSITTLINRFISVYGSPAVLALGTISDCFDFPQITLSNQSFLSALAELTRPFPDCVVWLDYSQTIPTLNVTRRDDCTVLNLAQDGTGPLLDYSLTPREELQVEEVLVNYLERDADGLGEGKSLTSGTASEARKRLVATISGPELDTFLPNELFDKVPFTLPATLVDWFGLADSATRYFEETYGFNPLFGSDTSFSFAGFTTKTSCSTGWDVTSSGSTFYGPRLLYDGTTYSVDDPTISTYTLIAFGEFGTDTPPDWAIEQYGLVQGEMTGGIYTARFQTFSGVSSTISSGVVRCHNQQALDDLLAIAGDVQAIDNSPPGLDDDIWYNGRALSGSVIYPNDQGNLPYQHNPQIKVWLIPTANIPSEGSDLTREADWDYLTPPTDLAANLKAAQDWLPYDGSIHLGYAADPLPSDLLAHAVNITSGPTELSAAKMLCQGLRLTLGTGKAELRIGAPQRNDFETLARRFRRTPQDNVIFTD